MEDRPDQDMEEQYHQDYEAPHPAESAGSDDDEEEQQPDQAEQQPDQDQLYVGPIDGSKI